MFGPAVAGAGAGRGRRLGGQHPPSPGASAVGQRRPLRVGHHIARHALEEPGAGLFPHLPGFSADFAEEPLLAAGGGGVDHTLVTHRLRTGRGEGREGQRQS